jgi:hypothetical protein
VVEITRSTDEGDEYPYYAGHWYGPDGKSIGHDLSPGLELVDLLPPPTLEGTVAAQLKELQDRIQLILDKLPPN